MKKILVPVDFSDCARHAAEYALKMARDMEAFVEFFHVEERFAEAGESDHLNSSTENSFEQFIEAIDPVLIQEVSFQTNFAEGELISTIAREVTTNGYDLVVSGTTGIHIFSHEIPGSVSAFLVGNVNVPVLVVPEGVVYQRPQMMVYAIDFEDLELTSVRRMQAVAQTLGAHLRFLHVRNEAYFSDSDQYENYRKVLAEALNDEHCSFAVVRSESVENAIKSYGIENSVDWWIMRTHLQPESDDEMSSQTRKRIWHTDKPVLVWPTPAK